MENHIINKNILKLWEENFEGIKELYTNGKPFWPLLFPNFTKETILFVGINPSTNEKEDDEIKDKKNLSDTNEIDKWIRKEKECIHECKYKRYFKILHEISEEIFGKKNGIDHLDLFFYRKTNSKKNKKKGEGFINILGKKKYKEFFNKQLKISLDIKLWEEINPKIIFVANPNASSILIPNDLFDRMFEKKEEEYLNIIKDIRKSEYVKDFCSRINTNNFQSHGFDTINLNGRDVPIFFAGMISSARQIDKHSLRRLEWHLKRALKFYKENNK